MPTGETIRPFRVEFPEEAVADLRRRVAATRWPDQETVADDSQGPRASGHCASRQRRMAAAGRAARRTQSPAPWEAWS
jgi:Epoxide hydrolase N terminus